MCCRLIECRLTEYTGTKEGGVLGGLQMKFENEGVLILFHLKSSFRSRDIQIFVFFSLPFHTFQIQKGKWKWNNL